MLDVASYRRTTRSRNILLSCARIEGDNETKCCADDRSQHYVRSGSHGSSPAGLRRWVINRDRRVLDIPADGDTTRRTHSLPALLLCNRAMLDVAFYGRTTRSRNILLSGARID